MPPRQHLVQHNPQRINICLPFDQFWRHIGWSTDPDHCGISRVHPACDAKIGQVNRAVFVDYDDVGALDITLHHAHLMGIIERGTNRLEDV